MSARAWGEKCSKCSPSGHCGGQRRAGRLPVPQPGHVAREGGSPHCCFQLWVPSPIVFLCVGVPLSCRSVLSLSLSLSLWNTPFSRCLLLSPPRRAPRRRRGEAEQEGALRGLPGASESESELSQSSHLKRGMPGGAGGNHHVVLFSDSVLLFFFACFQVLSRHHSRSNLGKPPMDARLQSGLP